LLRLEFRAHVVELQFRAQKIGGGAAVAGQHHDVQTFSRNSPSPPPTAGGCRRAK
jgi:hypothetical protein